MQEKQWFHSLTPKNVVDTVGGVFSSLVDGTTQFIDSMFVDKVDYEGDFKICAEVYKYMRSGNYQKLRRLCCLGIPRKVRAYVWYSLLIQPTQTSEIFDLSNKSQFELYWKNIEEFSIDTDQFVVNYDIDIIDFDVARTYPIGYDLIFQLDCIRSILRRVLRMYVYLHPNGYFQGLNDIVSILLIVLLDMYTHQNLVVDSVVLLNKNKFDIIEATTFMFLETISSMLASNVYGSTKDLHSIGLMTDFIETLQKMNSRVLTMDEQF
ncbi:Rab-GAP TBC domain-containing protein [Entamoeba marina]